MTDSAAAAFPPGSNRNSPSLGLVEKWMVRIAAAGIVSLLGIFANGYSKQGETLQTLVTQQAVTNGQLQTISAQLADVPALTRTQAEIKVQIAEHDRRLNRLEEGSSKLKGWQR